LSRSRKKARNYLKNSLGICTKLHKETITLSIKFRLPQIGELGQTKPDEQVHKELKEEMHSRKMVVGTPLRVTNALIDEHLAKPT